MSRGPWSRVAQAGWLRRGLPACGLRSGEPSKRVKARGSCRLQPWQMSQGQGQGQDLPWRPGQQLPSDLSGGWAPRLWVGETPTYQMLNLEEISQGAHPEAGARRGTQVTSGRARTSELRLPSPHPHLAAPSTHPCSFGPGRGHSRLYSDPQDYRGGGI